MDARLKRSFLSLAAVLVAAGCIISQDEFAGHACAFDADCPQAYACVGPEGQRSCEVLYPPRPSSADAGPMDAGVVPTYCVEIQPILAGNCVSSCHGEVNTGSNRADFRLDYYEPDAGQPPGARAMASRIRERAFVFQTMPPAGNPAPSASERALLARWAQAGAPFCADGGSPDAGGN